MIHHSIADTTFVCLHPRSFWHSRPRRFLGRETARSSRSSRLPWVFPSRSHLPLLAPQQFNPSCSSARQVFCASYRMAMMTNSCMSRSWPHHLKPSVRRSEKSWEWLLLAQHWTFSWMRGEWCQWGQVLPASKKALIWEGFFNGSSIITKVTSIRSRTQFVMGRCRRGSCGARFAT